MIPTCMDMDQSGNFVFGGYGKDDGILTNKDILFIYSYDSNGNLLYDKELNGYGDDWAMSSIAYRNNDGAEIAAYVNNIDSVDFDMLLFFYNTGSFKSIFRFSHSSFTTVNQGMLFTQGTSDVLFTGRDETLGGMFLA